jgi:fibronectin type 3 domain-containing protein
VAVSYIGVTTVAAAGQTSNAATMTLAAPALPAGTAAGHRVFYVIGNITATPPTPSGWSSAGTAEVGTGTVSAGAGPRRLTVFYRDYDGAWTMPSITLPATDNQSASWCVITLAKGAGETWTNPLWTTGNRTQTTGTAFTATGGSMAIPTGGAMITATVTPSNLTRTAQTLTATGVTFSGLTERHDSGTGTGADIGMSAYTALVTTGATAAPVMNVTLSASSTATAGAAFVAQGSVVDNVAPSVPTGLSATQGTVSVDLTWTASTDAYGVASYRVRRGGTLIGSPTGTTFSDETVASNTSYSYTVSAVDNAGNESAQSTAYPITTGDLWTYPDLVIDSSTAAPVATTAMPQTSNAFTPPAGALLVSLSMFDTTTASRTEATTTLTGDTSAWTQVADQAAANGACGINWATATTSVSTTVQSTYAGAGANPLSLYVPVFVGAQVKQGGQAVTTTSQAFTVTRSSQKSRVMFIYSAATIGVKPTAPAGLTELHWNPTSASQAVWISDALSPGDATFTFTGTSANAVMAWVEVAPLPVSGTPTVTSSLLLPVTYRRYQPFLVR